MGEQSRISAFFEKFIIAVIVLVLVQTFLEDFSILAMWSWNPRKVILIVGFVFDFVFVVEFLIRFYYALVNREVGAYLLYRRGWLDFISSFPLLILNSGPTFLTIVFAGSAVLGIGGILNILKVVKAIRIARILRLLRVLKIFKQIKHTDSEMAQRHVAKITTLSITTFILIIFLFSVLGGAIRLPSFEKDMIKKSDALMESIVSNIEAGRMDEAVSLSQRESDVLILKHDDKTLYSRYSNDEYKRLFGPSDYRFASLDGYGFFTDTRTVQRQLSKESVIYFAVIIILVVVFLVYYSPHFAITVTDPIHVMRKGMTDPSYNLEVKVPSNFKEDDIFKLAAAYNEVFLPMKDRCQNAEEKTKPMVEMDMSDIKDLFGENES